jgi:UDP:flavonoid glycosyltransferase YjiC (YdhE family)
VTGNPSVDLFWEDYSRPYARREAAVVLLRNLGRRLARADSEYVARQRRHFSDVREACRGADVIVFGLPMMLAGLSVAEALDVPCVPAYLDPIEPTRAFPNPYLSRLRLGPAANYWLSQSFRRVYWRLHRRTVATLGRELPGLPDVPRGSGPFARLHRPGQPTIFGYSPAVLPKPEDWGPDLHVTGYWTLPPPAGWTPSAALIDFLSADPPPVYAGFGSVHVAPAGWRERSTPRALARTIVDAIVRTGRRGLVLMEPSLAADLRLPDGILPIDDVPFAWLFPRVAAAVHHGGAGTTGAAVTAGIPSVVVPFHDVHPFWARRLHELGVATRPLPARRLTVARLAEAIATAVSDPTLRARATELGEHVRREDGVARAAVIVREVGDAAARSTRRAGESDC